MRYKLLGRSGLRVSELCLGTMTFGEAWGWGASREESRRIFERFAEAGGNFIDSAVNYTDGQAEALVGELVSAEREHFVIATKFSLTPPHQTDPNQGGNSRKNMMQSVERSLRQLGTDYIDLLYVHLWDFMTPVEEVMRGLDDLVRQGKVLYVGISDTPAWIVAEANARAELMGWSRFVALQAPYALNERSVERAELPMARHWDMAVLAFSLLGGGVLTGKYRPGSDEPRRYDDHEVETGVQRVVDAVAGVAEEVGRTPSQVAINWVRQQQARAQIIPALGARTLDQLEDNLACLEWELTAEQLARLDAASAIDLGFPLGWMRDARQHVYGATLAKIDTHRPNPIGGPRPED